MTEQQAIKRIKIEMEWESEKLNKEAFNMGVEALEKQIPQKPDLEGDGYDPEGNLVYDTWICPNCEKQYEVDYDNYDYCPNCGQKIDWNNDLGE